VGEAPVTPVYALDSSFLTFPTNRAITQAQMSDAKAEYVGRWASKGHMSLSHVPRSMLVPPPSIHQANPSNPAP
jgi:hypothetical protein